MEHNVKDKFKQILIILKSKIKAIPVTDYKPGIIFFYFLKLNGINTKTRYLIEIMKVMKCDKDELIFEPKYAIFYSRFFDIVLRNLKESKKNSEDITFNINNEDLNHLDENEKTIVFWYMKFSILVENALLLLFCFLNHEKNETKLISTFTYLNENSLDNAEELQKSYKMQINSKELKKINKNKELNLIGFESMESQNIINKNSSQKKKNGNCEKDIKSIEKSKLNFLGNNGNIDALTKTDNNINKIEEISKNISSSLTKKQNDSNSKNKILENEETKDSKNKNISEKRLDLFSEKSTQKNPTNNKINNIIEVSPEKINQLKPLKEYSKNTDENSNKKKITESRSKESIDNSQNKNKDKNIIIPFIKESSIYDNYNNLLKKGLYGIKVNSYFIGQKLKYSRIFDSNKTLVDNIKKLNINNFKFNYSSKSANLWKITDYLKRICVVFSNANNLVNSEYGFFFTEKELLFYTSDEETELEKEIMFNSVYLKQLDYDYAFLKESSYKSYSIKEIGEKDKIDYFVIKGLDFEKNWTFFFDSHFQLQKLPNIFFPAYIVDNTNQITNIDSKDKKDENILKNNIDNLFSSFIETDLARINRDDFDLQPKIIFKPYINEFPIHIYYKKEEKKWVCETIIQDEFKVYAHSIVLAEVKNSVPEKLLNIDDNDLLNKKDIQRSLYFVLYKLVKKIDYYYDFIKYEYLNNSQEIDKYVFQLFLVYDNKPISQMNNYIKTCFDNFIKKDFIKYNFIFQIIYSVPAISCMNMHKLNERINQLEKRISSLENKENNSDSNKEKK